jgi:Phage replication protein CRI
MLDTIKVGILLTQNQHRKILAVANDQDRWQWVQFNPLLGELRCIRSTGLVKTDSHSHHRELRWDIDAAWSAECRLWIEFSIPKFWYGHNIHLLHYPIAALATLKKLLEQFFRLTGKARLPDPGNWILYRADLCYAWRFPNQTTAQEYLDSLKHLHYPRKHPTIHPTSIVFVGATYSVKFYLKLPEFRVHDLKELRKAKASIEWMTHLEDLANAVLRFEVTLRRQWLKKHDLVTVEDLLATENFMIWDSSLTETDGFIPELSGLLCLNLLAAKCRDSGVELSLTDGQYVFAPSGTVTVEASDLVPEQVNYIHPGGGFTVKAESKIESLLQEFLDKFLGKEVKMLEANQVEAKLLEVYKPVKAARLVSLWLYVQRFGTERAKQTFGENSYYRSKREFKQAGISLIEANQVVTKVDSEFLRNFSLAVPSPHVVNLHDDFRDKANVLNFVPKVSGQY